MSEHKHRQSGFTLVELMIVVAIIGILGATSIAAFSFQQARARRTEAMTNLEAIAKLQRAYFGENGTHPKADVVPLLAPGQKQPWDAAAEAEFGVIGFRTEGQVLYVYDTHSAASGCACSSCFTASAYGDSDRDGSLAVVAYFHADAAGAACPVGFYPAIGPPIDPGDGLPIFEQPADINFYSGPIVDDF